MKQLRNDLANACYRQDTTYMPTAADLDDLQNVAIRYAISVLEGMQPKWTDPDMFIQSEIDTQKSYLI